ncbi:hypothetical protein D3C87_1907540 [compost metagenome]
MFQGVDQVLGVFPIREVRVAGHRVPVHFVQVADLHFVALGFEGGDGLVTQGGGKGLRLRVGVDDQYFHGGSLDLFQRIG